MKDKSAHKHYYLMMLPGYLWLLLFSIVPMFGIVIAFQDYNPGEGMWHSQWVGLDNFKYMLSLSDSKTIFFNTIYISVLKIFFNLVIPLIFALMLNEVRITGIKKGIQTVVYLPYFISWVVLAGIVLDIFGYNGPINGFLAMFGKAPTLFFAKANLFPGLVVGTDVWKGFGYNTIIYLAALTGINPTLYEAAAIDGAGRIQRLKNITMPGISMMVAMLFILSLGNVLNAGFDQIFNLYNPLVYSTGDIIDTWVYRTGILNMQFSLATAVGLLKSAIGFVMITVGYWMAYKFADYRIF